MTEEMTENKWPDFEAVFNQWDAFVNSPGGLPTGWEELCEPGKMPLLIWSLPAYGGVFTATTITKDARFKLQDHNTMRSFYKYFDTLEEVIDYTNKVWDKY